jgi:hypothetical protein
MSDRYVPRFSERLPAQTFWLCGRSEIKSVGPAAAAPAKDFRRAVKNLSAKQKKVIAASTGRSARSVVFRQGKPRAYLKKIRLAGNATLPAGESGPAGAESFRLEITPERIVMHASTATGFRYANQSLWGRFDPSACFFTGGVVEDEPAFPFRAFLLSLAHNYRAPCRGEKRKRIKRFDLDVAKSLIRRIADARMNAVMIDIENAVRYRSHPEIARSHSAPMSDLRQMVRLARKLGLEVIPKTNFSKSPRHGHNDWFEPYHRLPDGPEYFRRAGMIMDELIGAVKPRYYQIGMDEDKERGKKTYIEAVKELRKHLLGRDVMPIMWIDLDKGYQPKDFRNKMETAARVLPRKNLVMNHWQYYGRRFPALSRLKRMGRVVLGGTSLNRRWETGRYGSRSCRRRRRTTRGQSTEAERHSG